MKVGQPVDIKVDAYKGVDFHGHVAAIAPASQNTFSLVPAQNATGNFVKVTQRLPVRIIVDNPPKDNPLRVGHVGRDLDQRRQVGAMSRDPTLALALSASIFAASGGAAFAQTAPPAARAAPQPRRNPRRRRCRSRRHAGRAGTPRAQRRRAPRSRVERHARCDRHARWNDRHARWRPHAAGGSPAPGGAERRGLQGGGLPPPPVPAVLPPVPNIAPGIQRRRRAPCPNGDLVGVQQQPFVGLSLQDAIAMALQRNTDLALAQSNRRIANYQIVAAAGRVRRALPARAAVLAQRRRPR